MYILFQLKIYRVVVVIFHDIEKWYKIWRKTDLLLGKWHEEFDKFSPEHSKVSKLELWWNPFVQRRKCMSLKFTEKLCVMKMKNDTKIEEELTSCFKIDIRNFTNFHPSTRKSKKIVFYLAPCDQSIYCLSCKSTEELSFMTLKSYANFEEKLTCGLKILWFDKFLPGHLKVSKLRLWWDPFVQNRKGMCHDSEE